DRNVLEVLAPDQAVVPVRMAEVLVLVPFVGLGIDVAMPFLRIGGDDRRALVEVEGDVALEMNRDWEVIAGREANRAGARGAGGVDGLGGGGRVQRLAAACGGVRASV